MPSQHYSMGGIDVNEKGSSEIKGFYAAGECACVSVHGGNRLGGNSLLDTIVFGKLGALAIDEYLQASIEGPRPKALVNAEVALEAKIKRLQQGGREKPFVLSDDL